MKNYNVLDLMKMTPEQLKKFAIVIETKDGRYFSDIKNNRVRTTFFFADSQLFNPYSDKDFLWQTMDLLRKRKHQPTLTIGAILNEPKTSNPGLVTSNLEPGTTLNFELETLNSEL